MFHAIPLSRRLLCVYMGIALGLAAIMIYIAFLAVVLYPTSQPMELIPIQVISPTEGDK